MAEYFMKEKAQAAGLPIEAKSAGLFAFTGDSANENALAVMREKGMDLSAHRARKMSVYDVEFSDYIAFMTGDGAAIASGIPKGKILLPSHDISDPYGKSIEQYRQCRDEIEKYTEEIIEKFSKMKIVPMTRQSVPQIAEIEQECFSRPWSEKSIAQELKNENAHFFVAQLCGEVFGYIGMHTAADECYIANVAVRENRRKGGTGEALVRFACEKAKQLGCSFISLEVRKSNEAAVSLYKKCGFSFVGERKKFYSDPEEDAYIMTKYFTE